MSTTGLTAQAEGSGNATESRAVLLRAGAIGLALGIALIVLFPFLRTIALAAFQAAPAVELRSTGYFNARIWGAPAALIGFAINGWLIGTGRTRALLVLQVVLNGVNAGLDAWFVAGLRLGPSGIGAGTAIAEWVALGLGLWIVRAELRPVANLFDRPRMMALLAANRDIMIRTLALLFSFAWFVNSGAKAGTAELAGNEVLLQFITVAAFVLDAFAFVAEKEVGEAFGARDPVRLRRAVRLTTEFALGSGVAFSILYLIGGSVVIGAVVADPAARAAALAFLPYCAVVPLLGMPAWQLDGIFLGTTRGRALRTAGVVAAVLYVATDLVLAPAIWQRGRLDRLPHDVRLSSSRPGGLLARPASRCRRHAGFRAVIERGGGGRNGREPLDSGHGQGFARPRKQHVPRAPRRLAGDRPRVRWGPSGSRRRADIGRARDEGRHDRLSGAVPL